MDDLPLATNGNRITTDPMPSVKDIIGKMQQLTSDPKPPPPRVALMLTETFRELESHCEKKGPVGHLQYSWSMPLPLVESINGIQIEHFATKSEMVERSLELGKKNISNVMVVE